VRQSFLKDELHDVNFIPPLKSVKRLMFKEALPGQMPLSPHLLSEILGKISTPSAADLHVHSREDALREWLCSALS